MTTYFANEKNGLSEKIKKTANAIHTIAETFEHLTEMKDNIIDEREGMGDNTLKGNALDDLLIDVDNMINALQGIYDGYSTSEFNSLDLNNEEEVDGYFLHKTV